MPYFGDPNGFGAPLNMTPEQQSQRQIAAQTLASQLNSQLGAPNTLNQMVAQQQLNNQLAGQQAQRAQAANMVRGTSNPNATQMQNALAAVGPGGRPMNTRYVQPHSNALLEAINGG